MTTTMPSSLRAPFFRIFCSLSEKSEATAGISRTSRVHRDAQNPIWRPGELPGEPRFHHHHHRHCRRRLLARSLSSNLFDLLLFFFSTPAPFSSPKPLKLHQDVSIPIDNATGAHRGFGFVEFEEESDAAAASLNMEGAELFGRTLRVNQSQSRIGGGSGSNRRDAIWADGDAWNERAETGDEGGAAFKRREVGGGGGSGAAAAVREQQQQQQPPSAPEDPMAAAEAALG